MDKNIPLSELIRIGSKVTKQCIGLSDNNCKSTCAVGAALVAKRGQIFNNLSTSDCVRELGISRLWVKSPTGKYEDYLSVIIINLNDTHHWTRERIADWLESIGL